MEAAEATKERWAAVRRRSGGFARAQMRDTTVARVLPIVALALAGGAFAFAVLGYAVTQRNDLRTANERHAALQLALEEFRAVFGDVAEIDGSQLRFLEQRAAVKDLRFETEPVTDPAREVQSLHDRNGRILGWFSWAPDRALVRAMNGLWWAVGAVAVALAIFAAMAALYARRIVRSLADSEEIVRKLTSEDELTGLPNRRVMRELLERALTRRRSGVVAFALVDLDGFREVNDTLGRAGGDSMLKTIAERLIATLPNGATCGRYEDDEFAIILSGDDPGTAARLAEAVRVALAGPIAMNQTWQIGVSIGLAQAPEDGTNAEELTRRAGLALLAAKRKGRGLAVRFEPAIETEHHDSRFILRELKAAVSAQALDVHYQPVVAADGLGMLGVEALLRWHHATRGSIAPSVFIPIAEQNGLMSDLGAFVLRRALADAARWPQLFVAVNLSPIQMCDHTLVNLVGAVMAENAIAASRVVLEVTEGVLIDDAQEAVQRLESLRALGVRIALDDFGAGYSSLSYLRQFPFDRLKIDRAFVVSVGEGGNASAIIQSIVTLGHALGMKVLAEGIETDEQRVLLRLAGCDEMQGFLFAEPGPAEEIDKLLTAPAGTALRAAAAGR